MQTQPKPAKPRRAPRRNVHRLARDYHDTTRREPVQLPLDFDSPQQLRLPFDEK